MPNRIIKESIRESDSINQLSMGAEVLFYRLITYADDYGLFKADPRIMNPAIFPLKGYKEKQIIEWLNEIGESGMVAFYKAEDGKVYGAFLNWADHQHIRNNKPKYPSPNGSNQVKTIDTLLQSIENKCNQLKTNVAVIQSNPIQSESNPLFDIFWKEYPKKKAKAEALKAFRRLSPSQELFDTIMKSLGRDKKSEDWIKNEGKFIPHPASWLNGKRWEDEVDQPKPKSERSIKEQFEELANG